ncbi:MAG: septum formation initiator family protein [Mucilaginibacter polytrichastri]|nr:septum formation initiator family protein [Mucilaginibacter polytrichastri]
MKRVVDLLKNKFFLVTLVFIAWMIFFDRNDLLSQFEYHQEMSKLENEKTFYQKEIERVNHDMNELKTNKQELEKFAREKYLMKKDDEDVFVIKHEKAEEDR